MTQATSLTPSEPNYQRIFVESSRYQKEDRPLGPVDEVVVKGAMDVYIVRDDRLRMVVAGETLDAVRGIETRLAGGSLIIGQRHGNVTLQFAGITIQSSGGTINLGNGTVISTPRAAVALTMPVVPNVLIEGSGNVKIVDAAQPALSVRIRGSGDFTATGRVNRLAVKIAGSGDVDATRLECCDAGLEIAGSGDLKAFVTGSVDARIMGSGDMTIYGNPSHRRRSVMGSGDIRFR